MRKTKKTHKLPLLCPGEHLSERRDIARRLGRYFGTSAQLWVNLQVKCDLEAAEE